MHHVQRLLLVSLPSAVLMAAGCGSVTQFLNPSFVQSLSGAQSATLPGDAQALLVTVQNRTGNTIEVSVSYRGQTDTVQSFTAIVGVGESTSQALFCPVSEITLGDVSDLKRPGALVLLGNGTPNDPFIEVEPFGVLLKDGANYNCGDALTFAVITSSATKSGYQTIVFVNRAEN